ncbi:MAG: sulfurtransferase [Saprospiraceae bacterium]|nr:sulfurtransferase [Saprospiraceae bacterium]
MATITSPLIKPQELLQLFPNQNFILIDARSGAKAKEAYATEHLTYAQHIDLDTQMANIKPNPAEGGRHPLPTPTQFVQILSTIGIMPNSHVIIYDDKNGANAAARLWWMLKAIGHQQVQVIDGGMQAAIKVGYPLSSDIEKIEKIEVQKNFYLTQWTLPQVTIEDVSKASNDDQYLIIDVRESGRYRGEFEPLDLVAGHIPNSVNVPFIENLDTEGYFLAPTELKEKYKKILDGRKSEQVIVHCGSGVTACHTLLAMDYAGLEIPQLYIGSWSEWSRNNLPMVTSTEK